LIYLKGKIAVLKLVPNNLMKLSSNNWFLDAIHIVLVVRPTLIFSRLTSQFDKRIVDGFVNNFGVLNVLIAHLLGAFDRYVIDGLVKFIAGITSSIGNMTRSIQGGKVQLYYVWAIAGILLIYIFVF
jgi:NADH-quinone oxidoreductase subunit L